MASMNTDILGRIEIVTTSQLFHTITVIFTKDFHNYYIQATIKI